MADEKREASSLLSAAKDGDWKAVIKCCEGGSPVDEKDANNVTALYLASSSNCPHICEFLLQNGADLTVKTRWKSTPLHAASERGYSSCVLRLLLFGAELNSINRCGETPLHLAAKRGHKHIVELLVGAGAKLNVTDKHNATPLQAAAAQSYDATVAVLSNVKDSIEDLQKRFHDAKIQLALEQTSGSLSAVSQSTSSSSEEDQRPAARLSLAWQALQHLPVQWQEDIATVFREQIERADLVTPDVDAQQLEAARNSKTWILEEDYSIKGDVPLNSGFWAKRSGSVALLFEVDHRQHGTNILKVLIGLQQKSKSQRRVAVQESQEDEILRTLPRHPNILAVTYRFAAETKQFKRFLPLVMPSHLRDAVRFAKMATCLVTEKYPLSVGRLLSALYEQANPGVLWSDVVGETLIGLIMMQALSGIKHLQDNGIVHGNVCLEKLLLDKELHVVIGDFSSAVQVQAMDKERSQEDEAKTAAAITELHDLRALAKTVDTLMHCPVGISEEKQPSLFDTLELSQDHKMCVVEAPSRYNYSQSLSRLVIRMQSRDPTSSMDVAKSLLCAGAFLFFRKDVEIENKEDFRCWITAKLIGHTLCGPENASTIQDDQQLRFQVGDMMLDGRRTLDAIRRGFLCQTTLDQLWTAYKSVTQCA